VQVADDPAPGFWRSKADARNLDCQPISEEGARARYPGRFRSTSPRGSYISTRAVVCRQRLMGPADRAPRDEAILSRLGSSTEAIAARLSAAEPQLKTRTWMVETYYPSAEVAAKIAFATKVALLSHGRRVSDRVPTLGAGDLDVLRSMPRSKLYSVACRRYRDQGDLKGDKALLGVLLESRYETILHAGTCIDGTWRWLQ